MYVRRFYDKVGPAADAKAARGEVAMAPEGASASPEAHAARLREESAEREGR
jgi:hypothetical protein